MWAAVNGIINGCGNDQFGPDDNITREQLAVMLYRYEQFSGMIPSGNAQALTPADENSISDYAQAAVNALVDQGIINGRPGNILILRVWQLVLSLRRCCTGCWKHSIKNIRQKELTPDKA